MNQAEQVIIPFQKNKKKRDLRLHLNGPVLLGNLSKHLDAIGKIEKELEDSIVEHITESIDPETGEVTQTSYTSTKLDKETIAVYHTRINARKLQLDVGLKMLNKVMPDLKAVETLDDIANASERALRHFAMAAAEGTTQ